MTLRCQRYRASQTAQMYCLGKALFSSFFIANHVFDRIAVFPVVDCNFSRLYWNLILARFAPVVVVVVVHFVAALLLVIVAWLCLARDVDVVLDVEVLVVHFGYVGAEMTTIEVALVDIGS